MHSFEVDIRICQLENSEYHFRGLTNPDVDRKRMHQLFCYITLSSLFLALFKAFSYYINLLKSDVPSALSLGRLFQQYTSQISATLMR